MESDSQPASSSEPPPLLVANVLGGAIALLTLVLPLLAIANYSPSKTNLGQQTNYSLPEYK